MPRIRTFTASSVGAADPWTAEFGRLWMLRLAAGSFVLGAAMEAFMVKTGFYRIVTAYEAREREEKRVEWEMYVARQREAQAEGEAQAERDREASAAGKPPSRWRLWPLASGGGKKDA